MRGRYQGWPLFLRIFAVLLASVLILQVVDFALLTAAGPPAAAFRTVDEVAAALRVGGDRRGDLFVDVADVPPERAEGGPFARVLAWRLGVPADRVRVAHERPWRGRSPFLPMPFRRPHGHDVGSEVLAGRFVAALRRPDGRWLTVRPIRNEWEIWRRDTLLWIVAAFVALVPFALLLARWLARPIALFATAAERLGRDPHAPMLPVAGPPEIREAAATFNEMQRRLTRYVEDRTLLIGAMAHDLRTPLMRIALRLKDAPAALRLGVEADVGDMQAMIAAAASFVRDATRPAERRLLDLRSLVESVVDDLTDQGANVRVIGAESISMIGSPTGLRSLVSNLVGNAVNYAGDADVRLWRNGDAATIDICDHGEGIAEADLPHVFEPFFRGERSRNRETGGFGLGLASARTVARAHGGEVVLVNRIDGGLQARITLPI